MFKSKPDWINKFLRRQQKEKVKQKDLLAITPRHYRQNRRITRVPLRKVLLILLSRQAIPVLRRNVAHVRPQQRVLTIRVRVKLDPTHREVGACPPAPAYIIQSGREPIAAVLGPQFHVGLRCGGVAGAIGVVVIVGADPGVRVSFFEGGAFGEGAALFDEGGGGDKGAQG